MKTRNPFLLLKTFLSAVLFSLSFLFIKKLGFLILASFFLLIFIFLKLNNTKEAVLHGFLWGITAFGIYFIWIYELLLCKSQASFLLATNLYIIIICVFSFFTSCWFCLATFFNNKIYKMGKLKILNIIFFCYLFFYFIEKHSFFFLGEKGGFPFLNPAIPLIKYKFFLLFYHFIIFNCAMQKPFDVRRKLEQTEIIHLKPVVKPEQNFSALTASQLVYHQLSNLNLEKHKNKNIILVAPETYFPYALNKHREILLDFWSNVLPENVIFLFGSQRQERVQSSKIKFFQTVYLVNTCRIIDFYDKKHRVPFVEKIPKPYKKFKWSNKIFLNGKINFSKSEHNDKIFKFSKNFYILPRVCSEFFFKDQKKSLEKKYENYDIIFLFINDSWFLPYFKSIMKNLTILISRKIQKPVLYIGHKKVKFLNVC